VNKLHLRLELIVSGSLRSLYAWRPAPDGRRGSTPCCLRLGTSRAPAGVTCTAMRDTGSCVL